MNFEEIFARIELDRAASLQLREKLDAMDRCARQKLEFYRNIRRKKRLIAHNARVQAELARAARRATRNQR